MRSGGDYYQLVAVKVVHEELKSLATWQPEGDTSVSAQPAVIFIWRAAADAID